MSLKTERKLGKKHGFSLVETLFYVSIMVLVLALSVSAAYSLTNSYRRLQSAWVIESAAAAALERITRETRDALSVGLSESLFDVSPGRLALNTTREDGATTTIQFLLDNQTVRVREADVDAGPLTPARVRVTRLLFRRIIGLNSQAIKVEITLESGQGSSLESKNFYSTVVMRGSYALQ